MDGSDVTQTGDGYARRADNHLALATGRGRFHRRSLHALVAVGYVGLALYVQRGEWAREVVSVLRQAREEANDVHDL